MASVDYRQLAGQILDKVGGEANIASMTHCATRLRLKLKDEKLADKAGIERLPGVITVMPAGGQYQIVIGNNVPILYEEMTKITKVSEGGDAGKSQGNIFNGFVEMISAIFNPFLWTLAGAALVKAFVGLAGQFKWLDPAGNTYAVLNAAGDAVLKFLPVLLAMTAAKRFRANPYTSVVIAGGLMYLELTAWTGLKGSPTDFFGIPIPVVSYVGSVIPIIVAVWVQGYIERFLNKRLPSVIRNFTTPLVVVLVMVPLVILTIGPVTTWVGKAISGGIMAVWQMAPWLAGALMGGFWQVFVIFGIHWSFVPVMMIDLADHGYSLITGAILAPVMAQAAAALAVFFRTKNLKLKEVAAPGVVSGFLAGITEPIIYGVTLPLKKPFIFGCIGGAVGGGIAAAGGSAMSGFAIPSVLSIPLYLNQGSFAMQLIGTGVGSLLAFGLTLTLGFKDVPNEVDTPVAAAPGTTLTVAAPVSGKVVALGKIEDKVFASAAMGNGLGIVPSDGSIYAPISGTLVATMATGHAFGIKSDEGVEVLVHVGIDTLQLEGKGFTSHVEKGQRVKQGDLLVVVDLESIKAAGYDTTTIVVVTNTAKLAGVAPSTTASVKHGEPAIVVTI